jgi:transposase
MVFVDESGFSLLPGVVSTYAPWAQTPVLRPVHTRDHVSVMSGITRQGRLDTRVRREALDSLDRVVFLKHVRPHVSDTWLVSWDGWPMHKGHVNTCLAEGGAKQIHVEQLPPYAPDLNPGEGVWHHVKKVERRHLGGLNLPHLRTELGRAIRRLRRKPHVMTAFFAEAG